MQLVDVGISDGLFTVVSGAKLTVGTKVIVDESDESQEKKARGLF